MPLHPRFRLAALCVTWPLVSSAQTAPTSIAPRPATPGEAVQLSAFEVSTSKDIGYQSSNSAEVTRMNTAIVDIPMNVTVFNQQFMEDILARDTTDVLGYEASVRKTTENDGFLARGVGSVSANFLNGFAQPAGFGSQSVANIERVEVIKGPAAVLYGQGGYGATINRVTKRPLARPRPVARRDGPGAARTLRSRPGAPRCRRSPRKKEKARAVVAAIFPKFPPLNP